ncbi:uncharacterized protein RJT21DRAFT_86624 [Scheffersomyces amazonensis]|uniref:uncharacterized protein n=1 Tax=Scheffersomyces amazonensis TaxID=1078765 RepID=UPI00315D65BE
MTNEVNQSLGKNKPSSPSSASSSSSIKTVPSTARRRNRPTKVCDFCRRRKVKCDLGNPCSTCVKYGNKPCRSYESAHHANNEPLDCSRVTGDSLTNPYHTHNDGSRYSSGLIVQEQLLYLQERVMSLEDTLKDRGKQEEYSNNNLAIPLSSATANPSQSSAKYGSCMKYNYNEEYTSLKGVNPIASSNDMINFYEGYTSVMGHDDVRRTNSGPLSWITLIRTDSIGHQIWNFVQLIKSDKSLIFFANLKPQSLDLHFTQRDSIEEGFQDVEPFSSNATLERNINVNESVNTTSNTYNETKAKSLGISFFEGGFSQEMALAERIQLVMPKRKVMWLLYKRYFSNLYTAIPLCDEVEFEEKILKLIEYENTNDDDIRVKIRIDKKLDFATLGLLLIVLRLSYLTLFTSMASINNNLETDDQSNRAQEMKYLLNNPIDLDCIDIAQMCLNQFDLTSCINIEILQLALYTRVYHCYAPEDGDGSDGGDALVYNAMLVKMAVSLGLNRDPDNYPDQYNDQKINNLRRKIWYVILMFDVNNAMSVGTHINVDPNSFDTKPPFYIPGNENCIDVIAEKQSIAGFVGFGVLFNPLSDLMKIITNIRNKVKLSELADKLSDIERIFSHETESYTLSITHNAIFKQDQSCVQALHMRFHFTANFFMVSIFFHIFNYYQRKGNSELAYFYLKKIVVITVRDLMPLQFLFLHRSETMFKNSTDLIITPAFEMVTHKSIIVLTTLFMRLKLAIYDLENYYRHNFKLIIDEKYKTYYESLKRVHILTEKSINIFRENIAKLSHRYYYAWRITKVQKFLSTLLSTKESTIQFKLSSAQTGIVFTGEMLSELGNIFESSLKSIREYKKSSNETSANVGELKDSIRSDVDVQVHSDDLRSSVNINDTPIEAVPNSSYCKNIESITESVDAGSFSGNIEAFMPDEQIDTIWMHMKSIKKSFNKSRANTNNIEVPTTCISPTFLSTQPINSSTSSVEQNSTYLFNLLDELNMGYD